MGFPQSVIKSHSCVHLGDLQFGLLITKAAVVSHVYKRRYSISFILYFVGLCAVCVVGEYSRICACICACGAQRSMSGVFNSSPPYILRQGLSLSL